jgi:hypothetical protein
MEENSDTAHSADKGKRSHGKSRFWEGVLSVISQTKPREPKKCKKNDIQL